MLKIWLCLPTRFDQWIIGPLDVSLTAVAIKIKGTKDNAKTMKAKMRSKMRFIEFNFNGISYSFKKGA
jgi:hypothetical protein